MCGTCRVQKVFGKVVISIVLVYLQISRSVICNFLSGNKWLILLVECLFYANPNGPTKTVINVRCLYAEFMCR